MPTETHEHHATDQAMEEMYQWLKSGTNEGASFNVSRLTDDAFTDSFIGGGDISQLTPSGKRGTIKSQLSHAYILDSNAGPPKKIAIDLTIDLNTAKATLKFTPQSALQTATLSLDFTKTVNGSAGKDLMFGADEVSDGAAYSLV